MSRQVQSGIRLQKFLADLGMGSRREIEHWIEQGRIRIDGKVALLGDRVTRQNRISVDGRPVRKQSTPVKSRVLIYNKPEGEICSRDDPSRKPTVFRNLPRLRGSRWVVVGRLDLNSRGLLLFTNNGELANRLMHPAYGLEREYLCRVFGRVEDAAIERLKQGITLDRTKVRFREVRKQRGEGSNTWYKVVVGEGKYREVRRMWEAVGCRVSRLVRVRYGAVTLPKNLRQGHWMELRPAAVRQLFEHSPVAPGEDATDSEPIGRRLKAGDYVSEGKPAGKSGNKRAGKSQGRSRSGKASRRARPVTRSGSSATRRK